MKGTVERLFPKKTKDLDKYCTSHQGFANTHVFDAYTVVYHVQHGVCQKNDQVLFYMYFNVV